MRLKGSVLANPEGVNCAAPPGFAFSSVGHNLDSDGTCGLGDPTDLSTVDPMLGPLQSNGGPTPTQALRSGSPAIDRMPTAACTLTGDQRGGARPREGNGTSPSGCDVGAYEVARCADGLDNDGDGRIDFDGGATAGLDPVGNPDPNCASALGNNEKQSSCGLGFELALIMPATIALHQRRLQRRAKRCRQQQRRDAAPSGGPVVPPR
jgi:hypothetical protein